MGHPTYVKLASFTTTSRYDPGQVDEPYACSAELYQRRVAWECRSPHLPIASSGTLATPSAGYAMVLVSGTWPDRGVERNWTSWLEHIDDEHSSGPTEADAWQAVLRSARALVAQVNPSPAEVARTLVA